MASQDFEAALASSEQAVAAFDQRERSWLEKFQHILHSNQAAVSLIVLVASIAIRSEEHTSELQSH